MSMTDPAQIAPLAEGLTKAQREAVLGSECHPDVADRVARMSPWMFNGITYHNKRARLINPTPVGALVRAHLAAAQEKKDVD